MKRRAVTVGKGKLLGVVLMLGLGAALLYCALRPPHFFIVWYGGAGRDGCGSVGAFFLLAGAMNALHKEK